MAALEEAWGTRPGWEYGTPEGGMEELLGPATYALSVPTRVAMEGISAGARIGSKIAKKIPPGTKGRPK